MIPSSLPNACTRLLVVAPHPDDETIATGGLIQQVLALGGEVRVLLLTNGDRNPWPQRWLERRWRLDAAARRRWGERRRQEWQVATARLGLAPEQLQALDWPDMGLLARLEQQTAQTVGVLRQVIAAFAPTLVVLPALRDLHPDHAAAHVLMRLAMVESGSVAAIWTYCVHQRQGHPTSGVFRAADAYLPGKLAALDAFASQLALSAARMQRLATQPECYEAVAVAVATPTLQLPWQPIRAIHAGLWLTLVDGLKVHRVPWQEAPLQATASGWQLSWPLSASCGPRFVRLSMRLASPWIYDHWGWATADAALRNHRNPN